MQAARGASLTPRAAGRPPRRALLAFFVAGTGLALDALTKALAVERLADRPPVQLVGELLQLTLTRNPGAAFSTGTELTPVISTIALVAAAVVTFYAARVHTVGWAWALGLLLAGITGNLVDRLFRDPGAFHGHVVDFIALPHWPVFNVADICINLAAALLLIQVVRGVRPDGSRESAGPSSPAAEGPAGQAMGPAPEAPGKGAGETGAEQREDQREDQRGEP